MAAPNTTEGNDDGSTVTKISLKIKTTSDQKFDVCVSSDCTVLDLKKAIQQSSPDGIEPSLQRLIYKGKVLKDDNKICEAPYNMKDQHTVILVKSRAKRQAPKNQPVSNDNNQQQQNNNNNNNNGGNNNNNNPYNNNNNNNNNAQNPMANLMGMMGGNMGGMGGFGGMGGMGGLAGNMDPNTMLNMMNNPVFQQMTDQLLQNPQMLNAVCF